MCALLFNLLQDGIDGPKKRTKAPTGEGPSAKVPKVTAEVNPTAIVESVRNGKVWFVQHPRGLYFTVLNISDYRITCGHASCLSSAAGR